MCDTYNQFTLFVVVLMCLFNDHVIMLICLVNVHAPRLEPKYEKRNAIINLIKTFEWLLYEDPKFTTYSDQFNDCCKTSGIDKETDESTDTQNSVNTLLKLCGSNELPTIIQEFEENKYFKASGKNTEIIAAIDLYMETMNKIYRSAKENVGDIPLKITLNDIKKNAST